MQLDAVISDVIPQSFNMRLPQQAFSMLCSLSHLQEQASSHFSKYFSFYTFMCRVQSC